jgi:hypothetical protein
VERRRPRISQTAIRGTLNLVCHFRGVRPACAVNVCACGESIDRYGRQERIPKGTRGRLDEIQEALFAMTPWGRKFHIESLIPDFFVSARGTLVKWSVRG